MAYGLRRAWDAVFLSLLLCIAGGRALAVGGTWGVTGSLHTARIGHTATLLANGHVLVTGGEHARRAVASTELYSPDNSSWIDSGDLNVARSRASAALLPDERVIVAGGCTEDCRGATTTSVELFDRRSGSWSLTGEMATARAEFGMALLPDGTVLVAGGCTELTAKGCTGVTATAEIYDPASGVWSATDSMSVARGAMTMTTLADGTILAAGGFNGEAQSVQNAEIYDPASGTWTVTGEMNVARSRHAAVLLEDGTVLVAGGKNAEGRSTSSTEVFDPAMGQWTVAGKLIAGRFDHSATLLGNGNVLAAGGTRVSGKGKRILSNAEVYNPVTGVWLRTGKMSAPRSGHRATMLESGQVIVTGGRGRSGNLATVEVYTP